MFARMIASALALLGLAAPAAAETELSFYSGYQTSPHSRIDGTYPGGGGFNALIGWEGRSFEAPLYYGGRAMYWREDGIGFGIEATHAKAYAPDGERGAAGFDRLEFTDGLNIVTLNVAKRWPDRWRDLTPYVGAGLGFSMPHVDITPAGGPRTYEYQFTGAAARLYAGVSYDITENWSLFGEYQFTVSQNDAELSGGGDLSTRIITNAINVGVSYGF